MLIYIGDSGNVINRILTNHCSGNVEGSILRRHIAVAKGYEIKHSPRPSGATKIRIDREGEDSVSNYIRSGRWKYVICDSKDEARDFQWYAIEYLEPLLNVNCGSWNQENTNRYAMLLEELKAAGALSCDQLRGRQTGPGVYALYHVHEP